MYELHVPTSAIPTEPIPLEERIDPGDPGRYQNTDLARQAIASELYESLPVVLHTVMVTFPAEFSTLVR